MAANSLLLCKKSTPLVEWGKSLHKLAKGPGHVAVPATVFAHLGLTPDPSWGWEAPAFGM